MSSQRFSYLVESNNKNNYWPALNWQIKYFEAHIEFINIGAFGMGGSDILSQDAEYNVTNSNFNYIFRYNTTRNTYELENISTGKVRKVQVIVN